MSGLDPVIVVGFALMLIYFGMFTGRVNPLFYGGSSDDVFSSYAHAAEIGQFCCLFLFGGLAFRWPREVGRALPMAASALLVLGYALTLLQSLAGVVPLGYTIVAGALFGAGQGASFLGWVVVYARLGFKEVALSMVASTVLSGLLLLLVGKMPTVAALFVALAVIVAASCVLLFSRLGGKGGKDRAAEGSGVASCGGVIPGGAESPNGAGFPGRSRALDGMTWLRSWVILERRALLCLIALAFVCGVQRVVSLEGFLAQSVVPFIFALGYIAGAFVYLWALDRDEGQEAYFCLYTILLAVMATCGVFSFAQSAGVQTVLYAIDNVAFTVVSICMVTMTLSASQRAPFSPVVLAGSVCGAMYFSIQLGRIVSKGIEGLFGTNMVSALVVSVIIIYVLALAAISSGAFLRQVMGANPRSEGLGAGGSGAVGAVYTSGADALFADAPGESGAHGESGVRGIASAAAGEAAPREGADGRGATGTPTHRVISIAYVTEEQLRANPVYRQGYGLTDREIDTLVLLLAGYNSSDIAANRQSDCQAGPAGSVRFGGTCRFEARPTLRRPRLLPRPAARQAACAPPAARPS